jgi:hypothetical protein
MPIGISSVKELKRNNRECKKILIGPPMAPCFFGTESPSRAVLATRKLSRYRAKIGGMDGTPTTKDFEQTRVSIYRV